MVSNRSKNLNTPGYWNQGQVGVMMPENSHNKSNSRDGNYESTEYGINQLKVFEGSKKDVNGNLVAYNDKPTNGNATKGYGILLHRGQLTDEDIKNNPPQSEEEADKDFRKKLKEFEKIANNRLNYYDLNGKLIFDPIAVSSNQFDALVWLTYNNPGKALKVSEAMRNGASMEQIKNIWLEKEELPGNDIRRQKEWNYFQGGKIE